MGTRISVTFSLALGGYRIPTISFQISEARPCNQSQCHGTMSLGSAPVRCLALTYLAILCRRWENIGTMLSLLANGGLR